MPAPEPAKSAPSRRTRTDRPASASARQRGRKTLILAVGGIAIVLGGLFAYYHFALSSRNRHHEYAVTMPVAAPRGEPVAIGHDLKAGDVFHTTFDTQFRIVLSVDLMDPKDGMYLDANLTLGHGVTPKEGDPAGGLLSTYRVVVNRAKSNPQDWKAAVWLMLGTPVMPCRLRQDRDADGRPRGRATGLEGSPKQAEALRSVFCGLDDVATNYLPPRPVRLGDVWDLSEAISTAGILSVLRIVSRTDEFPKGYIPKTDEAPKGFPDPKLVGKVAAEAVEQKDGEECLRCRLVVYVTQEGEVVEPALPGRLSTAAKIEGHVWVSTGKGILWASDLAAEITTSYLSDVRPTERRATATIKASTARADHMPE